MKLNQVTIKSKDVSHAAQFYLKLGLELIVDASPRYVRFLCPKSESTLSISYHDIAQDNSTTLYFEVEDLDKTYKKLRQQGIEFKSLPEDKCWLWRETDLLDPDGHPLKLFSAGANRINPPWKVITPRWYEALISSPYNLMK